MLKLSFHFTAPTPTPKRVCRTGLLYFLRFPHGFTGALPPGTKSSAVPPYWANATVPGITWCSESLYGFGGRNIPQPRSVIIFPTSRYQKLEHLGTQPKNLYSTMFLPVQRKPGTTKQFKAA